jgi:polyhydroxyalkanoate synthesis regulator phasin
MTAKTTERANEMFSATSDLFWNTWAQSLGMMTWASDQAEKLVRTWMDQGRVTRDEGIRLQREMVAQARANQRELQQLITRTVQEQSESYRSAVQGQLDELRARVDEMNAELRAWREKAAK